MASLWFACLLNFVSLVLVRGAHVAISDAALQSFCSKEGGECGDQDTDTNSQLQHGYRPSSRWQKRKDHLETACWKKQVLLIIDMQRDYSVAYNQRKYGYIKNPFLDASAPPIEDVVHNITENAINAPMHWDMIAFSQDWLVEALFAAIDLDPYNQSFCLRYTEGAEPFQELLDAAAKKQPNQIRYTKNQDNVFNTLEPDPVFVNYVPNPPAKPARPDDYPDRSYDVSNRWNGKTLQEVLAMLGYTPENTQLTVVGTLADMCVLKSTVHAASLGYEVQVYVNGINGGSAAPDEAWDKCEGDAMNPQDACCVPLPDSDSLRNDGWQETLYTCQAAAGYDNALEYMKLAGAKLLYEPPSCPGPHAYQTFH